MSPCARLAISLAATIQMFYFVNSFGFPVKFTVAATELYSAMQKHGEKVHLQMVAEMMKQLDEHLRKQVAFRELTKEALDEALLEMFSEKRYFEYEFNIITMKMDLKFYPGNNGGGLASLRNFLDGKLDEQGKHLYKVWAPIVRSELTKIKINFGKEMGFLKVQDPKNNNDLKVASSLLKNFIISYKDSLFERKTENSIQKQLKGVTVKVNIDRYDKLSKDSQLDVLLISINGATKAKTKLFILLRKRTER